MLIPSITVLAIKQHWEQFMRCYVTIQVWFPNDGDLWAQNLEHSILNGDPVSNVMYFAVVTFCAPIWEEASTSSCTLTVMLACIAWNMVPQAAFLLQCKYRLPYMVSLMGRSVRMMFHSALDHAPCYQLESHVMFC